MFNISRYIEKGSVKRDRIVADIKNAELVKMIFLNWIKIQKFQVHILQLENSKNMIEVNGTRIIW